MRGLGWQRNALAPGILAAITLFVAPALIAAGWGQVVLYIVAILAAIVGWFAAQAKQWVWVAVFAVIVVLWNPIYPWPWEGGVRIAWIAAQPIAAIVFLVAGAVIKVRRD
ncbi:DUF6804 family protein [Microbacterium sp. 10M-3C3]|jgi:hypothetical protein|uniref:DUF6804 family protein n=1 Tax=Microbacterium sp. 10M-3C3 TaxID=2483401 RepID=UPI000F634010|nr:DUF6804 family protein [Microbacterium sp. 10M-3C3]